MSISQRLDLQFTDDSGTNPRTVEVNNLIIAGWTGRDAKAIERHIVELEAIGVARPKKVPCFYRASVSQLTTAAEFQVLGTESSGEVEFVLLALEDGLWVGVGSDHTDRKVETYDVSVSKQMCAKPISTEFWRYDDISGHWDQLILHSAIGEGEDREDYQEGTVANMLLPEVLIGMYSPDTKALAPGTLMFCGTLGVEGGVRPAQVFTAELSDPVLDRKITRGYRIVSLPPEE